MKVWIEKPVEPSLLILAWQAPDGQKDRRRWAVGIVEHVDHHVFRYFSAEELALHNDGRTPDHLKAAGFVGYPAFLFELGKRFETDVMTTFMRRLPPTSRPDFARYEEYFSIRPGSSISGASLLALTEARLPGDGFSMVDPLDPVVEVCDASFEIAGFRYEAADCKPSLGDALSLQREPTNEHDPNAVAVYWQGRRIGFVNRLQAKTVSQWLDARSIACEVLRLNGKSDAPRAYAKISVRPRCQILAA